MNTKALDIAMHVMDNSNVVRKKLDNIKNVTLNSGTSNNCLITDAFSYVHAHPNMSIVTPLPDEKVILFLKPKDNAANTSLIDLVVANKKIGYYGDQEALLIRYLIMSWKTDISNLPNPNLVKLATPSRTSQLIIDESYFTKNNIYCVLWFTSLNNDTLLKRLSPNLKFDFVDYGNVDVQKLKMLIPFAKTKDIDLSVAFPTYKASFPTKYCASLDLLLVCLPQVGQDPDLDLEMTQVIVRMGMYDVMNYYSMYFDLVKQSQAYLDKMNAHIQTRDSLPILEQYQEVCFQVRTSSNVPGYYTQGTFVIKQKIINGLPLSVNSRVELVGQDRDEENGRYIVKRVGTDESVLEKYLRFDGSVTAGPSIDITGTKKIDTMPIDEVREDDLIYVTSLEQYAYINRKTSRIFLTLIRRAEENPTYDIRYECYDQPLIKSRGLCESAFDSTGVKPKPVMQWDRRCESNEECPFYQANKNYKNYYGGCIDGYCQMPLGLRQIAYRSYDKSSKPMCYNCRDKSNPYCCEDQKNKSKYPTLKSPDYAFPLDQYSRMERRKDLWQQNIDWYNK